MQENEKHGLPKGKLKEEVFERIEWCHSSGELNEEPPMCERFENLNDGLIGGSNKDIHPSPIDMGR
jgi:hypothetical protein